MYFSKFSFSFLLLSLSHQTRANNTPISTPIRLTPTVSSSLPLSSLSFLLARRPVRPLGPRNSTDELDPEDRSDNRSARTASLAASSCMLSLLNPPASVKSPVRDLGRTSAQTHPA